MREGNSRAREREIQCDRRPRKLLNERILPSRICLGCQSQVHQSRGGTGEGNLRKSFPMLENTFQEVFVELVHDSLNVSILPQTSLTSLKLHHTNPEDKSRTDVQSGLLSGECLP